MTIDPWDFASFVTAPYLAVFVLMLRRFFRKGGNPGQKQDDFAPIAFALAGVAVAVPAIFITLRILHVFIPYGSVWVGGVGLLWLAWAIWLQRRPAPVPIEAAERGAVRQKPPAQGAHRRPQMPPPRSPGR